MLMQTDTPTLSRTLGNYDIPLYWNVAMYEVYCDSGRVGRPCIVGVGTSIVRAIPSYAASWWGYELTLAVIERLRKVRTKENAPIKELVVS